MHIYATKNGRKVYVTLPWWIFPVTAIIAYLCGKTIMASILIGIVGPLVLGVIIFLIMLFLIIYVFG